MANSFKKIASFSLGILLIFISYVGNVQQTFATSAPTATNRNAAESYTEDTNLNLIDIVITDIDSTTVTATLTLSNPVAGSLTTSTSGAVTSTYNSGSGVWTASGAIADVNTLLAGVTFVPTTNFNASITIAVSITDDTSNNITGTKAVTGVAVNDAPTASNLSTPETYTQDTNLSLVDIVAADVDSSSITATLTLSSAAVGSLTTGTSGAVTSTYNSGSGVWTASGAIADVNTLLAGVTFVPTSGGSSNFTISTSISDGIAAAITGSKAVTGVAVNHAPALDSSKSPALNAIIEDTGVPVGAIGDLVSGLVDFATPSGQVDNVTDSDSSALLGIAITAVDSNFTCYYSLNGGTTWISMGSVSTSVSRLMAADSDNRLFCKPNLNVNGSFASAVTFRAWDRTSGTDGGTADTTTSGGTTAFSTATDGISLTVVAVNDAPTATNLSAAETYTQDQSLNLIDIVTGDIDSATLTATLTLSDHTVGSLSTGTSGAFTSTYNAGTGVWTASGTTADVNALLAGVIFTPTADSAANFTVSTEISDGSLSVSGTKVFTAIPVIRAGGCSTMYTYEAGTTYAIKCGVKTVLSVDPVRVTPAAPVVSSVAGPVVQSGGSSASVPTVVTNKVFGTTTTPALPITTTSAVLATSTAQFVFTQDLSYKSENPEVLRLQQFLKKKGFLAPTPNGYFGIATKSALVKFQKANGINPATGNFGPRTRAVINTLIVL